jgi:hypothetical protein
MRPPIDQHASVADGVAIGPDAPQSSGLSAAQDVSATRAEELAVTAPILLSQLARQVTGRG